MKDLLTSFISASITWLMYTVMSVLLGIFPLSLSLHAIGAIAAVNPTNHVLIAMWVGVASASGIIGVMTIGIPIIIGGWIAMNHVGDAIVRVTS